MGDPLAEFAELSACSCHACHAVLGAEAQFMVLCTECGCKRCPKATNHLHACTGSNSSGQIGSTYGRDCPEDCCVEFLKFRRQRDAEFDKALREIRELRARPRQT